MKYRELGNTGLKVSEIGMGCEGFAEDRCRMTKKLFDTAEASITRLPVRQWRRYWRAPIRRNNS